MREIQFLAAKKHKKSRKEITRFLSNFSVSFALFRGQNQNLCGGAFFSGQAIPQQIIDLFFGHDIIFFADGFAGNGGVFALFGVHQIEISRALIEARPGG